MAGCDEFGVALPDSFFHGERLLINEKIAEIRFYLGEERLDERMNRTQALNFLLPMSTPTISTNLICRGVAVPAWSAAIASAYHVILSCMALS